nr:hypothetical protein [Blautia sp. OF03-13]
MRHLMSPLDFSVEELDQLMDLANDIEKSRRNMHMPAMAKDLLLYFMNQAHAPVSALRLP